MYAVGVIDDRNTVAAYEICEFAKYINAEVLNTRTKTAPHKSIALHIKCYTLQISKLTEKQRSRLWHWRLGHVGSNVPIRMSRTNTEGVPIAKGIHVKHCINEDCIVCTKAKFRVKPFRSVPLELKSKMPSYFCITIDGFGGQHSMGVKAMGGTSDLFRTKTISGAV